MTVKRTEEKRKEKDSEKHKRKNENNIPNVFSKI